MRLNIRQDAKNGPEPSNFIRPGSLCSQWDVWEQWAMDVNFKLDMFCWPLLLSDVSQVNSDSCHQAFLRSESVASFTTSGPFCQRSPRSFRGTLSETAAGLPGVTQTVANRWALLNQMKLQWSILFVTLNPGTEMIKVRQLQKWWILNVCWRRGCSWRCLSFVHAVSWLLCLFLSVLFYKSVPGWHDALFRADLRTINPPSGQTCHHTASFHTFKHPECKAKHWQLLKYDIGEKPKKTSFIRQIF